MSIKSRQREHTARPKTEPLERKPNPFGLAPLTDEAKATLARIRAERGITQRI